MLVEVAKSTGVLISTVSRVLSKPNLVSPNTLTKVITAVGKLNYQLNRLTPALMNEVKPQQLYSCRHNSSSSPFFLTIEALPE